MLETQFREEIARLTNVKITSVTTSVKLMRDIIV